MAGSRRHLAKVFRLKTMATPCTGSRYTYAIFVPLSPQILYNIALLIEENLWLQRAIREEKSRFTYFLKGDKNPTRSRDMKLVRLVKTFMM